MFEEKTNKKQSSIFKIQILEVVLVVLLITLSFILASVLIYNGPFPNGLFNGFVSNLVLCALGIMILAVNKYFGFKIRPFVETMTRVVTTVAILNFVYIALLYFNHSTRLSLYFFIVNDALLITSLLFVKIFSGKFKLEIIKNRISLVIGTDASKNELLKQLGKGEKGKLAFINYNDEAMMDSIDLANDVYVSGHLSKKLKDKVISYCVLRDKSIYIVPETYEIAMRKSEISQVGDIPVFAIESFRFTEAQNIMKRAMDIVLAVVGLVLSFPLVIWAAVMIKKEDNGPILYKQVRSGLNGKEFEVVKFRSMIMDAEKYTGAVFALEHDPRITKIGKIMRATRIDEIPQFLNVLIGDMSMIGPRPERPEFIEKIVETTPEFMSRLTIKPGITGLAQVMGNYTTTPENKVKFDLVYIRNYSLLLDLTILFRTVKVIFSKEQSEGFSKVTIDIAEEIENKSILTTSDLRRGRQFSFLHGNHRIVKAILSICCCLIIIGGSILLRYTALAGTISEVVENIPSISTEKQIIATTYADEKTDITAHDKKTDITDADKKTKITDAKKEKQIVLAEEKMNTALEKIPWPEKLAIASKLISKISTTDLIILEGLAVDGFTKEEKAEAKTMMYEYYDEQEVSYIKGVYRDVFE